MRIVVAALLTAAALGLAACGGGGGEEQEDGAATGQAAKTFSVSETDFALAPSTFTIDKAGIYAFHAVNDGQVTHSLEIEGNGVEAKLPSDLEPGDAGTLKVRLEAGTYEIYCPVDGHKDRGMEGSLEVAGAGGQPAPTQTTTTNSSGRYGS